MNEPEKIEYRVIRPINSEHSHGYASSDNTKRGWLLIILRKTHFHSEVVAMFGEDYRLTIEKLAEDLNKLHQEIYDKEMKAYLKQEKKK